MRNDEWKTKTVCLPFIIHHSSFIIHHEDATMTELVFFLLVFVAVSTFFLFFHLMLGTLVRPIKPHPDKLTIYECGEPTIGSAWIQFDLRYYVVALLFVIFDVEVAFFFPWAVVYGKAN